MSKLFGEYLVDKGLISEDQLLEALIIQIEEQTSVVKTVRDLGLLKTKEILDILKEQAIQRASFLETAKKLSLMDQEKINKLFSYHSTQRTPLGEILVSKKILDVSRLTGALDEYFGDKMKALEKITESISEPTITSKPAPVVTNNGGAYAEIFEYLSPKYFHLLTLALESISAGTLANLGVLKDFCDEIHKVQSAAKLYEFNEMSDFLQKIESTLRDLITRKLDVMGPDILKKVTIALNDSKTVLENAMAAQRSNKLKSDFFTKSDQAKTVKSICDLLALVEFDISHLDKGV